MDLLYDIGHGPKRICTIRFNQGPASVCPAGYSWITVLEQIPGEDVGEIKDKLSANQLFSIRKQLAYILTELAKEDVTMGEQHPSLLRYDRNNDKLYLVDVTHWSYHEIRTTIGLNSAYVMAFGLWNEPVPDDEAYPWKAVKEIGAEKEQEREQEREEEKEKEKDSQREEVRVEKPDREKDFFSESDSERAPWLAGSLAHHTRRVSAEISPMFPGSRESPRRPGSCVLYYAENQPMLYGSPGSPRRAGTRGRENQPIPPGSRGSPERATPQGPQDSPLESLDVLSERLRAATLQAMGQTTDQGERSERSGRDGRGGRGGRQFDLRR